MIDSLLRAPRARRRRRRRRSRARASRRDFVERAAGFGVVTLHRRRTSTTATRSREALAMLREVAARLPLVWPVHPRTRANIERFGLAVAARRRADRAAAAAGLSRDARPAGGRAAGADRLRRHPGRDDGARRAVPDDAREHRASDHGRAGHQHARRPRSRARALRCVDEILRTGGKRGRVPELWDGHAARAHRRRPRGVARARRASPRREAVDA